MKYEDKNNFLIRHETAPDAMIEYLSRGIDFAFVHVVIKMMLCRFSQSLYVISIWPFLGFPHFDGAG